MAHDKEGDCSTNSATVLGVVLSGLNNFYWGVSLISRYYRPDGETVSNAAVYLGCILSLTAVASAYLHRKVNLAHQPDGRGSFLPDYETFPVDEHKPSSLSCPQKMAFVAGVITYTGDVNGGFFVGIDLITNIASVTLLLWEEIPLHVIVIALGLASAYASVRTSRHAILGEESLSETIKNPAASVHPLVENGADKWTNIAAVGKGMSKVFSGFYLGISLFYNPDQEGVRSDAAAISVGCFLAILAIFSIYAERSLNIYHQGHKASPPLLAEDLEQGLGLAAVEYKKEKLTAFQKLSLGSFALTTAGACSGLVTAATDIVTKKAFQTVLPQGIKDAIKGGVFLFGLFGSFANVRSCRDAMTPDVAVPVMPSERNSLNSMTSRTM